MYAAVCISSQVKRTRETTRDVISLILYILSYHIGEIRIRKKGGHKVSIVGSEVKLQNRGGMPRHDVAERWRLRGGHESQDSYMARETYNQLWWLPDRQKINRVSY